ncbi:hypothetical protein BHK69_15455 [Bosea vaviloviae]|uniref:Uncharacterized protein n=2 Tax=Bosea vaviloviae TaxID=1526658 RepID=A0A1D7U2Q9_9HYPH|nr:hypothetical protein BHK69_15455 [Bosea vaviloviae]
MQAAQARGIALTWPEAIAQASNGGGRGLMNLQRFTEDSVGGADIMGNFMARRPAQVEAASRQAFDTIAPQSQAPSTLGPAIGRAADDTIQEATGIIDRATSPAAAMQPAQIGSYEAALARQEALRQRYLEPLMAGPLGKVAKRDIETREAIAVLFPKDPLAGSAREIMDTVGALTQRNAMAARQLVRAHVEGVFNNATRTIQAKPNQFVGPDFVDALKGNSQQAQNLAAAIQGVGGPQLLQGFDEFLKILSATGQRLRPGSQGPFDKQMNDTLKGGGGIGDATEMLVAGRIKWPKKATEIYERWQLGQNTEEIARLITDPAGIETFRRLAKAAPGSTQAQVLAIRLAAMAAQAIAAAQPRK